MQDLTVIGVEDGALLVSSDEGSRFRLAIDEVLQSRLRQATPNPDSGRKLAPREIQAHIRSGMSADDVATITGVSLEYIQKFEGPVLAERDYVIQSALNVPVHTAIETDPMSEGSTFGSVIRERLQDLGASGERWASWKEAGTGWVVKLSFTADQIDHDARWHYEPKRAALAPLNTEANTLSQQGEMPGGLIPRLRAVGGDERAQDASRFDSGAFEVKNALKTGDLTGRTTAPQLEAVPFGRGSESSPEVSVAAINRAPADEVPSSQTADLLDALRRRRGERESAAAWDQSLPDEDDARAQHPATGSIRLVDVPLDDFDELDDGTSTTAPQPFAAQAKGSSRKGRATMPSWDEIVFGARSDDDLA